jgi:hypothetical protein
VAQGLLRAAEEPLQTVRRRRDARVIEALEQVLAIPRVSCDQIIDERARRRAEPGAWRRGLELLQVRLEPCLRFGGRSRTVLAVGGIGQLVGYTADDLGVPPDASCGPCFAPRRSECG